MIKLLPQLTAAHHRAIAKVAVEVARLDWLVNALLAASLYDNRPLSDALTDGRAEDKIRWCRAMLQKRFGQKQEIAALMTEVKAIRDERNKIVHWQWKRDRNNVYRTNHKPFEVGVIDLMPASKIDAIAGRATSACDELAEWVAQCRAKQFEFMKRPVDKLERLTASRSSRARAS